MSRWILSALPMVTMGIATAETEVIGIDDPGWNAMAQERKDQIQDRVYGNRLHETHTDGRRLTKDLLLPTIGLREKNVSCALCSDS